MSDLDPIALDRELASVHEDVNDWNVRLREEPEFFDDPFQFYRAHLGKNHFDELWEMPSDDPLREPLLRWTYWFTEQRINHWWLTHTSQLRHSTKYPLETPIRGKRTLSYVLENVLSPSAPREEYFRALSQHGKAASDALGTLWGRKQEIRDRFGLERTATLIDPDGFIAALAQKAISAPLLNELRNSSLLEWLGRGAANGAGEAMPGRLNEASIADWFRDSRLLEDLPLGSWTLPRPIAPAAFLRALDELGRRFRVAAGPTHQPFVIANDPQQLEAHALGYCFSSLLANPAFVERRLGLDRKHQKDYLRSIAQSLALDFAQRALKVLLREPALNSADQMRAQFQERIAEHFGAEPNPNLAFVLFRLRDDDAQRFLGAALGLRLALDMREQHDEDWFRNPRAIDQLRSQARLSPRLRVDQKEAEHAVESALTHLDTLLQ